jgi:N6-adenosine-specific RNA methylase IME4
MNTDIFNTNKKYGIIYADPPWSYRDKARAGNRGAECHYDCMTVAEIAALPVPSIVEKDAALFLWVTMPQLLHAFTVINAWGFEYKTVAFVWVKTNTHSPGYRLGLGHWTRSNAELCLLATRGKPKRVDAGVRQVIEAPIREHSQKPDEARDRIVQLLGPLPRIELFAKATFDGWDAWGNQVGKLDEIDYDALADSFL